MRPTGTHGTPLGPDRIFEPDLVALSPDPGQNRDSKICLCLSLRAGTFEGLLDLPSLWAVGIQLEGKLKL